MNVTVWVASALAPRCFRCGRESHVLDRLLHAYMAGKARFTKAVPLCQECYDEVVRVVRRRATA